MRSPCATSAGPVAAGAATAIKLGGAIATFLPQTGPTAQESCQSGTLPLAARPHA